MHKKILVPLDGSDLAERVIPQIEPLAEKLGSTLVLLQVTTSSELFLQQINPGMAMPAIAVVDQQPTMESEQASAAEYLGRWTARLRSMGYTVEAEHAAGHAATVIVERARERGADLIAMTTHGRGGLVRLVFGSVADSVLRHAPCPVLLVRVYEVS